jgi:hypothetical protein
MKDYTDVSDGNVHRNSHVCNTGVKLNGPTLIQNTSSILMSPITVHTNLKYSKCI